MRKIEQRALAEEAFFDLGFRPVTELKRGSWTLYAPEGTRSGVGYFALLWGTGVATVRRRRLDGGSLKVESTTADGGNYVNLHSIDPRQTQRIDLEVANAACWVMRRLEATRLAQAADRQTLALRNRLRRSFRGDGPEPSLEDYRDLGVALAAADLALGYSTPGMRAHRLMRMTDPTRPTNRESIGLALSLTNREIWDWRFGNGRIS
jgi:hypothetical protein